MSHSLAAWKAQDEGASIQRGLLILPSHGRRQKGKAGRTLCLHVVEEQNSRT